VVRLKRQKVYGADDYNWSAVLAAVSAEGSAVNSGRREHDALEPRAPSTN
jgi:hypothetical protein